MMFISVDLPEPDGPITATNSPSSPAKPTASRARTVAAPVPYTLETESRRSTSAGIGSAATDDSAPAAATSATTPAAEQAATAGGGGGNGAGHAGDDNLVTLAQARQDLGAQRVGGTDRDRPRLRLTAGED